MVALKDVFVGKKVDSSERNKEKSERGRMTGRVVKLESVGQRKGRYSRDESKGSFGGIRQSHTKAGGDKEAATCSSVGAWIMVRAVS